MKKFIEISKLIEVHKLDDRGSKITIPATGKHIIERYNASKESIEVDSIKSFRKWDKNNTQEQLIEGDVTLIYLKSTLDRETQPQILIHESFDSFKQRCPTILIE